MQPSTRSGSLGFVFLVAAVLAACAGQKQPAEKLIHDIQATVTADPLYDPTMSRLRG